MSPSLARLARMDVREIAWRGQTIVRASAARIGSSLVPPAWQRRRLRGRLTQSSEFAGIRDALAAGRWLEAHRALSSLLAGREARFLIRPRDRESTAARVARTHPGAKADSIRRADRLLAGQYDLLGYRGLEFHRLEDAGTLPDWHLDPVHGRRAPRVFWTDVPYLDPACGDHKIVWELNRHQHWIALGRAFWLTGDVGYRQRILDELASWLADNPPLVGINWASMLELGLRSISWLWALSFCAGSGDAHDDQPWTVDLLLALDRQLTHVERNLSYYFSPNTHLLGEALALYVCGRALPILAASGRRAALGRRILVDEVARQIAADGFHCERSTHYHRYTLDFYLLALLVARVTDDPIAAMFERTVGRLATAARLIADDSGRAPHIGDDDGGMLFPLGGRAVDDWRDSLAMAAAVTGDEALRIGAGMPEEADWLLAHPALAGLRDPGRRQTRRDSSDGSSDALEASGYYISRSTTGEHIVVDGGSHGYLNGGHAHADALSMTMSLHGVPMLIDTGTACYTVDSATRDRFRSSAAHNTVLVDGRSQSIPNGPFHWIHAADATAHRWRTTGAFDYFDGSHAGYASGIHRRRVLALHGNMVVVADYVGGNSRRELAVLWHVAPGWRAEPRGRSVTLRTRHELVTMTAPQGDIELFNADQESGLGWVSPVYGCVEPCTTIRISATTEAPCWLVSVFDLNPADPIVAVEHVPIWAEAGVIDHANAVRIARSGSSDYVLFAEPADTDTRARWRVGELETDARMLYARLARGGELTELALVDGSFARGGGRRALGLALGRVAPALYVDSTTIRNYTPCAASPGS